jgi:hypothetical protein
VNPDPEKQKQMVSYMEMEFFEKTAVNHGREPDAKETRA